MTPSNAYTQTVLAALKTPRIIFKGLCHCQLMISVFLVLWGRWGGGGVNTSSPQNLKGPNCYFLLGKLSEKKESIAKIKMSLQR